MKRIIAKKDIETIGGEVIPAGTEGKLIRMAGDYVNAIFNWKRTVPERTIDRMYACFVERGDVEIVDDGDNV